MERLLSPEEVAERLSASPGTVKYWLRKGALKGVKPAGAWRIRPGDLGELADKGNEKTEKLLTPEEVADVLLQSSVSVRRWLGLGVLKGTKIGGRWRVDPDDLEDFINRRNFD